MQLHLIRHPAVAVAPGICYGRSDVALAETPDTAAARLRALLPPDYALFSSPLQRCRLLAEQLGTPQLDPRLQEINFGEWELQSFDAIGHSAIDQWATAPFTHRPPGGESAREMAARALDFLAALQANPPATTVVVAHGGPLRVLAGHLLGLPEARWITLDFACARLCSLTLGAGGATLHGFNR